MVAGDDWFLVRQVASDLWLLCEPWHVCSWLCVGRDRAALIDTGTGLRPMVPLAARIAERPLIVLNTHGHYDHVGGNDDAPALAMGVATAAYLRRPVAAPILELHLASARAFAAAHPDAPEDRLPRPLPGDADADGWGRTSRRPDLLLEPGDEIDLGDRRLEVRATPGHSEDSLTYVDRLAGRAFVGDLVNEGTLFLHLADSDAEAELRTLDAFARDGLGGFGLCAGHVPHVVADGALVDVTRAALRRALERPDELVPGTDLWGLPARLLEAGRATSVLADPEAGPVDLPAEVARA